MRSTHILAHNTLVSEDPKVTSHPDFSKHATITRPIVFRGIGLHSGKMVTMELRPVAPNRIDQGIRFILGNTVIPAHWRHVNNTFLATSLSHEQRTVRTVEHILSALFMLGISAVDIHLDAEEVPIMDGSCAPFFEHLEAHRLTSKRRFLKVAESVCYQNPNDPSAWARLDPYNGFKLSIDINFPGSHLIGHQSLSVDVYEDHLPGLIANARTFVLEEEVELLQKKGLAQGGSLDNAIVIGKSHVLNPEGLRHDDECVRHKALDCIGDLALVGMPILGHFKASKPGHQMNIDLIRALFNHPHAYHFTTEM